MSPIQFVDLKKQYAPLKEEILAGVARILDGMQLFLGENVRALETEFAAFAVRLTASASAMAPPPRTFSCAMDWCW